MNRGASSRKHDLNMSYRESNKPLLPRFPQAAGTNSIDGHVHGDEDNEGAGGSPKRREVIAVACQPCRKRKSKCDGQRPRCSACVQKNRMNCIYDSASDMRRTHALKKRIDDLHDSIGHLKIIILALCGPRRAPVDEPVLLRLIQQTLQQGRWADLPELATLVEQQINPTTARPVYPGVANGNAMGLGLSPPTAYMPNQRMSNVPADYSMNHMDASLQYAPDIAATTQPMGWTMADAWTTAPDTGGIVQNGYRNDTQIFPQSLYGTMPNGMGN